MDQEDLDIVEVNDYATHTNENGYQSYHILVSVPVFMTQETSKMNAEIQIRKSGIDFRASLEHKISYKYNGNIPEEVKVELLESARISSALDTKMHKIRQILTSDQVK